ALGIKAPKRAPVGEEVTIGVFARLTQEAVEGAGVWAVSRDRVEALQQEAQKLKDDPGTAAEEKDYEAIVKAHGQFLGRTDKDGQLTHTFRDAGIYVLVAVKKGYFPGYAPLAVVVKQKALSIKVTPPQTHVGKEVTIKVSDRESNDPVEGAGVWAIARDKAADLRDALKGNSGNATDERDYEAAIASRGTFLGRTDADGKLSATFTTPGAYVLVTVKKGYLPGYTTLAVRDMPKPKPTTSDNRTGLRQAKPEKPELRPEARPVKPGNRPETIPAKPGNRPETIPAKPESRPQLPPNTN
ncbi:MAG: hypothetical protein HYX80_02440, partial [Chloroflexi bacterium]|nr:hypothetical protein [Chloroflexota bacterium]